MGVVQGDLHETGKGIVKIMFNAADFDVIDLGLYVKPRDIVMRSLDENADIIGLSTMMTTTMTHMKTAVDILAKESQERPLAKIPKIIIGGGCISQKYANEIGADGYSANAVEAVRLVKILFKGDNHALEKDDSASIHQ